MKIFAKQKFARKNKKEKSIPTFVKIFEFVGGAVLSDPIQNIYNQKMEEKMNYADIKFPDVQDGDGIRVALYVSGCHFH